jgi:ubiquinone/menaquinone biosynthesis C-methylase UbiE
MAHENNDYILGTERNELHRLGLQHQVWSEEARQAWKLAGFSKGDRILDLGSGPGFCTMELAYMVGETGKVIAVDKSEVYLDFIEKINEHHQLNIDTIFADFEHLILPEENLDGMFCRWALAWIPEPESILKKVYDALKPGGKIVIQEYFDWSTFQTEPHFPELKKSISAIYNSFNKPPSNINVGRQLPNIFRNVGFHLLNQRSMQKMVRPKDLAWQWPYSFLHIFLPKLIDMGLQSEGDVKIALEQLEALTQDGLSTIFCPLMVELIAQKPL